jgi:hypothetical protein
VEPLNKKIVPLSESKNVCFKEFMNFLPLRLVGILYYYYYCYWLLIEGSNPSAGSRAA